MAIEYSAMTVKDMQSALRDGKVTAADLLKEAKKVIQEKNGDINAFIEVFASAEDDAKKADEMLASGKAGPLTGIPIAVKDNICVKGNLTTAGSKVLEGFVSPYDATVISKLREMGMVIVGRTNMDEFGMGSSTEYSAYGCTVNPHDAERVAGGSSGGSAAAVAMGAVPLALGSDTGGSIRQPAGFCGVVGFKPTYGAVSRHGLIALASSLDVIGPFAKTVEDASLLFTHMRGESHPYDATVDIFKTSEGPNKKNIMIPAQLSSLALSEATTHAFKNVVEGLKQKGYNIQEIDLPFYETTQAMYYIIQPAEASSNLARYDGMRFGKRIEAPTLWDEYIASREHGFGIETKRRIVIGTYVLSAGYYDAYYKKAVQAQTTMREAYQALFKENDFLLLPTTPDIAFEKGKKLDPISMYTEDRLTIFANLLGVPTISVPMRTEGLPIGVQCATRHNNEEALFACATDIASLY